MKVSDAMKGIAMLGLDSSPIIHFVERTPQYAVCAPFFAATRTAANPGGAITAVTSVLARTEVLTMPMKTGDTPLEAAFRGFFAAIGTVPIEATIADQAADLRARYRLKPPDALHVATALASGCDAFLTGDRQLQRVTEINVIVLDDLTL